LIGDVLFFAVAAALTPTAILVGLLFLLTRSPRSAGGAYLGGWILGLLLSALVLMRLESLPAIGGLAPQDSVFRSGTLLLAGIALIVTGVMNMRSSRKAVAEPTWLRRVDSLSPAHAGGMGFLLAGLSPKLLILTAATVTALLVATETRSAQLAGLGLYVLIASLPIAVPVVVVLAEGERGSARIQAWKSWLFRNQGLILGGGGVMLGLLLVGRAYAVAVGGA
jgi:hypothetical protein